MTNEQTEQIIAMTPKETLLLFVPIACKEGFEAALQGYVKEIAKAAFYKGFKKCKNDDANCFTAWREESETLLSELKLKP